MKGKWHVVRADTGEDKGESDSKAMAQKHLAALYANSDDVKASDVIWAGGPGSGRRAGGMTGNQHLKKYDYYSGLANMSRADSIREVFQDAADAHKASWHALRTDNPRDHYNAAVANP